MVTAYFNGEIVRHKDMKQIQRRRAVQLDEEGRCRYGFQELYCRAWQAHCAASKIVKRITKFGRCHLGDCKGCPGRDARTKAGNKEKTFSIDWSKYRQVSSAAHLLIKESKYKTVFLTLTFPEFKTRNKNNPHKLTKSFYYAYISNQCFVKFAENLRKNYNCTGYIAVKEYGETRGRVHFHLLCSLPFVDFRILNNSWNSAISDYCIYSSIALQRDWKSPAIIRNPARAIRYVCKYISKCYGQRSSTRLVFISRNLLSWTRDDYTKEFDSAKMEYYNKPVIEVNEKTGKERQKRTRITTIKKQIPERGFNHVDLLKFKSLQIQEYEHVTVFKVTERKEFNRFCAEFLYPLFECSLKWTEFHHQITEN